MKPQRIKQTPSLDELRLAQKQKAEWLSRQGRLFRVAVKLLRPVIHFVIDEALINERVDYAQMEEEGLSEPGVISLEARP